MDNRTCVMCNNCEEIFNINVKLYGLNIFLFETKNFMVNIDTYPVSKNHILIIPKYHFRSFSSIDIEKKDELQYIINHLFVIFNIDNYIMFEHGTNIIDEKNKICGNSIFHAHLHIIPNITINENPILQNLKLNKNKTIDDYSIENIGSKYLLNIIKYDLPTKNNYLLFVNKYKYYCIPDTDIDGDIESQFFRKLISVYFNNGVYNWKDKENFEKNKEIYMLNILRTIKEFDENNKDLIQKKNYQLLIF